MMKLIRKWRTYETEEIPQEEIEKILSGNEENSCQQQGDNGENTNTNNNNDAFKEPENSYETAEGSCGNDSEASENYNSDQEESNSEDGTNNSESSVENDENSDDDKESTEPTASGQNKNDTDAGSDNSEAEPDDSENNAVSENTADTFDANNTEDGNQDTGSITDDSEDDDSYDYDEDGGCDDYGEDDDYDSDDYDYEDNYEDDYDYYGERKENKAFNLSTELTLRRLGTIFAQLIEHIAEERSIEDTEGYDVWDTRKLLQRAIDPQIPLSSCKKGKTKERVVLLLDTSGSCEWLADFYAQIAKVASEYELVEIYEAPNGLIFSKWDEKKKKWIEVPETENWNDLFRNRVIIFFGDFDGGDSVVEASRKNIVYWFSSENRYEDMDEHSWCNYTLADFKGEYLECYGVKNFINNVRKILKKPVWR